MILSYPDPVATQSDVYNKYISSLYLSRYDNPLPIVEKLSFVT